MLSRTGCFVVLVPFLLLFAPPSSAMDEVVMVSIAQAMNTPDARGG